MKLTPYLAALAASVILLFAACDSGGSASCQEACEADSDCSSGLSCFSVASGMKCLPSDCSACFAAGSGYNTCSMDEGEDASGMYTCDFKECR